MVFSAIGPLQHPPSESISKHRVVWPNTPPREGLWPPEETGPSHSAVPESSLPPLEAVRSLTLGHLLAPTNGGENCCIGG